MDIVVTKIGMTKIGMTKLPVLVSKVSIASASAESHYLMRMKADQYVQFLETCSFCLC